MADEMRRDTPPELTRRHMLTLSGSALGGLAIIYTSDTKPETHSIGQAANGGKGIPARARTRRI